MASVDTGDATGGGLAADLITVERPKVARIEIVRLPKHHAVWTSTMFLVLGVFPAVAVEAHGSRIGGHQPEGVPEFVE